MPRFPAALVLLFGVAAVGAAGAAPQEQRGIWAHFGDVQTPEAVQRTIERVTAAGLNTIYLLVWHGGGQAAFKSALCPTTKGTPEGHDPLGALIAAAHPKGIAVHAWFVCGEYGASGPGYVFDQHPDWELKTGAVAKQRWYDLGRPEVRRFQRDVMLDCLKKYDVDGIHMDYIRFANRGMCFCESCQGEVQKRFGVSPLAADGATFPIACRMSGNPLDKPTTARVLATFDGGVPALTLNTLGKGEVALFNWQAHDTDSRAVSSFVRQVLERFGVAAGATVYQVRNSETTARYGQQAQEEGVLWLRGLGCKPAIVDETQLETVPAGTTVVLHCQYRLSAATAGWLERFVTAGGHALVMDGPVFAIGEPALQRVLGLAEMGRHLSGFRSITPAPGQEILKVGQAVNIEAEKRRAAAWEQFRRAAVTEHVRQVYEGAKALKPKAWVSAAVFFNRMAADQVCQDWYGWLKAGIIDYVLPMAYLMDNDGLKETLKEYQAADPEMARILPGLSIYARAGGKTAARTPEKVLSQEKVCRDAGARGVIYFALRNMSPEIEKALGAGPYAQPAEPYYPAAK